jgi:hypothetical protein
MTGTPRGDWKPRDPLVAFLVGAVAVEIIALTLWLPIAVAVELSVRDGSVPRVLSVLLWLYPVAVVVGAVVAWRSYRRASRTVAGVAAAVPLLWVAPLLVIVAYTAVT